MPSDSGFSIPPVVVVDDDVELVSSGHRVGSQVATVDAVARSNVRIWFGLESLCSNKICRAALLLHGCLCTTYAIVLAQYVLPYLLHRAFFLPPSPLSFSLTVLASATEPFSAVTVTSTSTRASVTGLRMPPGSALMKNIVRQLQNMFTINSGLMLYLAMTEAKTASG